MNTTISTMAPVLAEETSADDLTTYAPEDAQAASILEDKYLQFTKTESSQKRCQFPDNYLSPPNFEQDEDSISVSETSAGMATLVARSSSYTALTPSEDNVFQSDITSVETIADDTPYVENIIQPGSEHPVYEHWRQDYNPLTPNSLSSRSSSLSEDSSSSRDIGVHRLSIADVDSPQIIPQPESYNVNQFIEPISPCSSPEPAQYVYPMSRSDTNPYVSKLSPRNILPSNSYMNTQTTDDVQPLNLSLHKEREFDRDPIRSPTATLQVEDPPSIDVPRFNRLAPHNPGHFSWLGSTRDHPVTIDLNDGYQVSDTPSYLPPARGTPILPPANQQAFHPVYSSSQQTPEDNDGDEDDVQIIEDPAELSNSPAVFSHQSSPESSIFSDDMMDDIDEADDDFSTVDVEPLVIDDTMRAKLYSYQVEGVQWMWGLHQKGKGGILGDDMGLGKTIQIIAFISTLFKAEKIKTVLIVLPVAVIANWVKEFKEWAPAVDVRSFHDKKGRSAALKQITTDGGVLLTSYGMIVSNALELGRPAEQEDFIWDYVILDEGHKIKNPSSKCAKGLICITTEHRLLLTGTPVMNHLKELWALFNWIHQGTLLGSQKSFYKHYEQTITRGRQKDANVSMRTIGNKRAEKLQSIIRPYFLRRTKIDINNQTTNADDDSPEMPNFTRKNEFVCWVYMSDIQKQMYEKFIKSEELNDFLFQAQSENRSPLTSLQTLKTLCDHPRLLSLKYCRDLGLQLDSGLTTNEELPEESWKKCALTRLKYLDDEELIAESGKLKLLVNLLHNLKREGHRCLVFSQRRKMLDVIERILSAKGHKVARLDGNIKSLKKRESIMENFSEDTSYSVFLLTTQVGGVGLTLTAADRVVIFDPSWNPATDSQAVDRAFRIGQMKNVVVYRLITCGTVEEKIYRRQIFKDSINRQTTGDTNNPYRYFKSEELLDLFTLGDTRSSKTQQQVQSIHEGKRRTDGVLDEHIAYLGTLDMFGISDHDLMFGAHMKLKCEEEEQEHLINNPTPVMVTEEPLVTFPDPPPLTTSPVPMQYYPPPAVLPPTYMVNDDFDRRRYMAVESPPLANSAPVLGNFNYIGQNQNTYDQDLNTIDILESELPDELYNDIFDMIQDVDPGYYNPSIRPHVNSLHPDMSPNVPTFSDMAQGYADVPDFESRSLSTPTLSPSVHGDDSYRSLATPSTSLPISYMDESIGSGDTNDPTTPTVTLDCAETHDVDEHLQVESNTPDQDLSGSDEDIHHRSPQTGVSSPTMVSPPELQPLPPATPEQSATVIKLSEGVTEEEALLLLSLSNGSTSNSPQVKREHQNYEEEAEVMPLQKRVKDSHIETVEV